MSPLHCRVSSTKGNKIRSGCLTLAFSGAQKRAEVVHHPCILGGPQQRRTKSEVAASPLPFQGTKRGHKCYITRPFSGVPNKRVPKQKWMPHPCLLKGPKEGGNETAPLHSPGSPTKVNKIINGCLTLAFSRAQERAEMLCHAYIVGCPPQRGTKSKVAASRLQFQGPKRGRKRYITPPISVVPNKGEQNQKWLPHPCLFKGPKGGSNATSRVLSPGSPTKGYQIKSGGLTPAFSRAQKRAEVLHANPA